MYPLSTKVLSAGESEAVVWMRDATIPRGRAGAHPRGARTASECPASRTEGQTSTNLYINALR